MQWWLQARTTGTVMREVKLITDGSALGNLALRLHLWPVECRTVEGEHCEVSFEALELKGLDAKKLDTWMAETFETIKLSSSTMHRS